MKGLQARGHHIGVSRLGCETLKKRVKCTCHFEG
jgi:hypothetical protein